MSTEDYDQAEKLFGGKWEMVKIDMEDFLTAAEFSEDIKNATINEKIITLTRVDNSLHYKTSAGGNENDFEIKLNEVTEWKEKEVDPVFHFATIATSFKDGVWTEESTPLEPCSGKRYILTVTVQDGMLHFDFKLPDDPSVRGKKIFKKCE